MTPGVTSCSVVTRPSVTLVTTSSPQGCCGDQNLRWISQRGIMPAILRRATGENYGNNLSSPAPILRDEGPKTHFVEVDSFIFYSQTRGETFSISEFKLNSEV